MRTDTGNKIVEYIKDKGQVSANDLADFLNISRQALYKQLKKLQSEERIYKIGRPPKVFYLLKERAGRPEKIIIDKNLKKVIENNFLVITPAGEKKSGWDGFAYWCEKHGSPIIKTAAEYQKTLEKYEKFRKNGFIDGMMKMKNTFEKVYLDNIFYLDFYSIERFGKTKPGQLLLYAKQSQNKKIMAELIDYIKPAAEILVKKYKIDGVGFIPPTVKRELQFMKELEKKLHLAAKKIIITKVKTEVAVPQKTLSRLEERVENAKATFVVEEARVYNNILLIDDALGSGATLNEVAGQIRSKELCRGKIIGLAITGSFKGFDVISEV